MTSSVNHIKLTNNGENNTISSFDQARRFEWRLQWEKSQLENWQSYQSQDQLSEPNKANKTCKGSCTDKNHLGYTTSSEKSGLKQVNQEYNTTYTANSSESRSVNTRAHIASKNSFVFNTSSETALKQPTAKSKQTAANYNYSNTYLQYKKPTSMNIHIYEYDGCVEIALRDKAIKNKKGIELIETLKNNLAKQGLNLTRLKLNGNVVINLTHGNISERVIDCAENTPINKTY
ncbi:hypothetical protein A3194_12430 [Candidatus Thiodiazotropha endoloripes]|uniref:hypothetical protein n=1 Tax=Candidatus Thiodiazotropha endoloripes TaxID=1818881 RepID=UPI00083D04ED|nr:hypothetical protein [Candidatus Thiodiazotropha endoloripes]ODB85634.1 hypothetical protein A3194_12430 [Candidatus Thiodiazotropha endoloripes]